MQQVLSVWNALDMRKRMIVAAVSVAVFAAVLLMARIASQPTMALLYSGLEPGPAGEVMEALEARGIATDVRGSAIYVDATQRDELRMTLAAEGLPGNSTKGYELLDNLSGFGTTAQMFDAAYWRAKEGELARTIASSPEIVAARVHIAVPRAQAFRDRGTPSGSVTVATTGGALPPAQARALKFLIASAVPGLAVENVSVIDSRSGLVMPGAEDPGHRPTDRAEELRRNVQRLLEARVGLGNAVVEVSVDMLTDREHILERKIDPNGRVAISTETTETSSDSSNGANGAVTVASNLPDGNASGSESTSSNTETRERTNFEVSETTREISREPGSIRRITVAVLVDGIRTIDENNVETWEPRSDAELAALRELIASAVGFSEERGDAITIKSLEFEPVSMVGSAEAPGFFQSSNLNIMALAQIGLLGLIAMVLGLFVLRPILSGTNTPPALENTAVLPALEGNTSPDDTPPLPSLASESANSESQFGQDLPALPSLDIARDSNLLASEDPVERLRSLLAERKQETVEILRGWMEDEEETA